jgi:hypothetical protein
MILSVSRRTDIPTYYTEWFMNRLHERFVYVRNPMNANQISKIPLNPDVVDCIVFWSKNPKPMMEKLTEIDKMGYKYYFQFTVTPYDNTIERALPDKEVILKTFIELSNRIGKEKVIWRYDPIILNNEWTINRHVSEFDRMLSKLSDFTEECIISFVDPYRKTNKQMGKHWNKDISKDQMLEIAKRFSEGARSSNVSIKTCAEAIDLEEYGIEHASCIDRKRIETIINCPLVDTIKKDSQREHCRCIECIDIGAYNTCRNGCLYCYANFSEKEIAHNCSLHDPNSALLVGDSATIEKITERKVKSFKEQQIRML